MARTRTIAAEIITPVALAIVTGVSVSVLLAGVALLLAGSAQA